MEKNAATNAQLLCPSAQPEMEGSVVFAVVGGTAEEPRLVHLAEPQPASEELLALSAPVQPTEVFRFAAPCAGHACKHFDGSKCRLAQKIVQMLPTAVEMLPPCRLRPNCRWWQQEGKAACMRCPQIVRDSYSPSEKLRNAANPTVHLEG